MLEKLNYYLQLLYYILYIILLAYVRYDLKLDIHNKINNYFDKIKFHLYKLVSRN